MEFGRLHLAAALAHQERLDEAHTQLEKLDERAPGLSLAGVLTRYSADELDAMMDVRKAGVPES